MEKTTAKVMKGEDNLGNKKNNLSKRRQISIVQSA